MVSEESLSRAWKRYSEVPEYEETLRGVIDVSSEKLDEFLKQTSTIEELRNLFITSAATQKNRKISEVLEIILAGALSADASDVHIEPQENRSASASGWTGCFTTSCCLITKFTISFFPESSLSPA